MQPSRASPNSDRSRYNRCEPRWSFTYPPTLLKILATRGPTQNVSKPAPPIQLGAIGTTIDQISVRPVRSASLPIAPVIAPLPPNISSKQPLSTITTTSACTAAGRRLKRCREVISINPAPKTKQPPAVAECAVNRSWMPKASRTHWASRRRLRFGSVLVTHQSEDLPQGSER